MISLSFYDEMESMAKLVKKRVNFATKVDVHEVDIKKEDNRNSSLGEIVKDNFKKASALGGGDQLAMRSLMRADSKCNCYSCEDSLHDHEATKKKFNLVINCASASLQICPICKKYVCELCSVNHMTKCRKLTYCQSFLHTEGQKNIHLPHDDLQASTSGKMRCKYCIVSLTKCESSFHKSGEENSCLPHTDLQLENGKMRCKYCRQTKQFQEAEIIRLKNEYKILLTKKIKS